MLRIPGGRREDAGPGSDGGEGKQDATDLWGPSVLAATVNRNTKRERVRGREKNDYFSSMKFHNATTILALSVINLAQSLRLITGYRKTKYG